MADAHQRNLVVVARGVWRIRQRIELQQRFGLRRRPAGGNRVPWKRQPIAGIENRLRKISDAHRLGWHQAAIRAVIAVARCLVAHEELPLPMEQVRNRERPAERRSGPQVVVRRFLRVLAGERIRPRVQSRIVQDEAQVALVPRSRPFARIADGASLNCPAAAAAHHHGVGRGLIEIAHRLGCRLPRGGLRCRRCRPGFRVNFLERQHLQIPNRAGGVWCHGHFLLDGGEAQHLHLNAPNAIGQAGKRIGALLVRHGDEFLVAPGRSDRGAWNRQAVEVDLSVMLGSPQARHRKPGEGRVSEAVNSQPAPSPNGR
jgi:hypothetical protein